LVKEASAEVESKDNWEGQTPLSCAALNGQLEVVKFLVKEAGADITVKDKNGNTALHLVRRGIQEGWQWGDQEGRRAVVAWLEKKARGEAGD